MINIWVYQYLLAEIEVRILGPLKKESGLVFRVGVGKFLSSAGKAIMLQAMAQAIPLYVMSCFKLPKRFIRELNMIFSIFWWRDTGTRKGIHWKNWDALCCSKLDGGLGFRDLEEF